jgi:hypothetical protein
MLYYELERLIHKYRYLPYVEIEVRFGWSNTDLNTFDTNIRERYFTPLHTVLSNAFKSHERSVSTVYKDPKTNARGIESSDPKYRQIPHVKTKLETVDVRFEGTPFDVRIAVSVETPIEIYHGSDWIPVRTRDRNTYRYKMWKYELTSSVYNEPVDDTVQVYEFEIELDCALANEMGVTSAYLSESLRLKLNDIVQMKLADNEEIHLKKCSMIGKKLHNQPQKTSNHVCHSLQKL